MSEMTHEEMVAAVRNASITIDRVTRELAEARRGSHIHIIDPVDGSRLDEDDELELSTCYSSAEAALASLPQENPNAE